MKNNILTLATGALCALALASCTTVGPAGPVMHGNLEAIERDAPVTGTPNVGQHEAGQNAVDYGLDRRYRSFWF